MASSCVAAWCRPVSRTSFSAGCLIQVADIVTPILGLAPWFPSAVTYAAIGGFPIVLILAWVLERSEGRWFIDQGAQPGRMFSGLERNYLSILVAYGIAAIGVSFYQLVWGLKVPESVEIASQEADVLLPVQANSIAVLRFLNIGNSEAAGVFSDGLGEDILDSLARNTRVSRIVAGRFVVVAGERFIRDCAPAIASRLLS